MTGLFFLYSIVALGVLVSVSLTNPRLEQGFWGYGEVAFSDNVVGAAVMLPIFLALAGTAFRILPWTKNKPLIAIKEAVAH